MPQFPLCRAPLPLVTCLQHKCFQGRLTPDWKAKKWDKGMEEGAAGPPNHRREAQPLSHAAGPRCTFGSERSWRCQKYPWGWQGAAKPGWDFGGISGAVFFLPGGHPIPEKLLERAENREKKENLFTWLQVDTVPLLFPAGVKAAASQNSPALPAPLPRT